MGSDSLSKENSLQKEDSGRKTFVKAQKGNSIETYEIGQKKVVLDKGKQKMILQREVVPKVSEKKILKPQVPKTHQNSKQPSEKKVVLQKGESSKTAEERAQQKSPKSGLGYKELGKQLRRQYELDQQRYKQKAIAKSNYLRWKADQKEVLNSKERRRQSRLKKFSEVDRKSTRLNSSHRSLSRMPSSA